MCGEVLWLFWFIGPAMQCSTKKVRLTTACFRHRSHAQAAAVVLLAIVPASLDSTFARAAVCIVVNDWWRHSCDTRHAIFTGI